MPDSERLLASYGRRKGRRLRAGKRQMMDSLLPELLITLPEEDVGMWRCEDAKKFAASLFPHIPISPHLPLSTSLHPSLFLEIGFGGGEHLAHQALLHPDTGIIGCEPYLNGVAALLAPIHEKQLDNIRIYNHDARLLIERLPGQCIERVFILYPDPWPKLRHRKRRLVSTPLLNALSRIMKPGAELRLATDDADYCAWMLEHLLAHPAFRWMAKSSDDWLKPRPDWISTRYERKALQAGRVPSYLNFLKE